jgi:hypothetical protein
MKGDAIIIGESCGGRMIPDNPDDVTCQFAGTLPAKQIGEAVVVRRNQDSYFGTVIHQCQVIRDHEALGDRLEVVFELLNGKIESIQTPFQPR